MTRDKLEKAKELEQTIKSIDSILYRLDQEHWYSFVIKPKFFIGDYDGIGLFNLSDPKIKEGVIEVLERRLIELQKELDEL